MLKKQRIRCVSWVKEVRTAIQWLKAKRANGNKGREKGELSSRQRKVRYLE